MRWPWRKPVREPYTPAAPRNVRALFDILASAPRWDYVSMSGPYRTMRCNDDDAAEVRFARVHADIVEAITLFATVNQPRIGQVCFLYDGNDQAILGWWDTHQGEFDLRFRWVGCKSAFDRLAIVDPVNAALWEQLAYQEVLHGHS